MGDVLEKCGLFLGELLGDNLLFKKTQDDNFAEKEKKVLTKFKAFYDQVKKDRGVNISDALQLKLCKYYEKFKEYDGTLEKFDNVKKDFDKFSGNENLIKFAKLDKQISQLKFVYQRSCKPFGEKEIGEIKAEAIRMMAALDDEVKKLQTEGQEETQKQIKILNQKISEANEVSLQAKLKVEAVDQKIDKNKEKEGLFAVQNAVYAESALDPEVPIKNLSGDALKVREQIQIYWDEYEELIAQKTEAEENYETEKRKKNDAVEELSAEIKKLRKKIDDNLSPDVKDKINDLTKQRKEVYKNSEEYIKKRKKDVERFKELWLDFYGALSKTCKGYQKDYKKYKTKKDKSKVLPALKKLKEALKNGKVDDSKRKARNDKISETLTLVKEEYEKKISFFGLSDSAKIAKAFETAIKCWNKE